MKKYNLLIDGSSFNEGPNLFSLDFYLVRLIRGFYEDGVFQVFVLVKEKNQALMNELVGYDVPKILLNDENATTFGSRLDRLLGIIPFRKELKARGIDVVLKTDLFTCNYFFGRKYHQHMIVHDMFPYYRIEKSLRPVAYKFWRFFRRLLMNKVKYYITISEASRKELKRLEGKDSVVVHNSLAFDYSIEETEFDSVKDLHYILYVSRFEKYKNAETLIRAFASIKDKIKQTLYLKGDLSSPEDYQDLVKLVSDLNLGDRVIFDRQHRSEGEMRYLYTHADLFVHPSLQEGFGWTPIEAAVLKAPVIVSNIDVLKEVTCGKLPMFDPHSPDDLADKMIEVLNNPPSDETRNEVRDFYLNRYSLKNQIGRMTEVIIHNIEKAKVFQKHITDINI